MLFHPVFKVILLDLVEIFELWMRDLDNLRESKSLERIFEQFGTYDRHIEAVGEIGIVVGISGEIAKSHLVLCPPIVGFAKRHYEHDLRGQRRQSCQMSKRIRLMQDDRVAPDK